MAREHSRVNISIWQDPDWRALPAPAQHLYLTLWTHPGLSYCGVVDWRPGRIAAMSGGTTTEQVNTAGDCLQARLFLVVDEDTEEVLIRSWARFDGLLKQPRMAVSYANAFAEVASNDLRGVIVHETKKLHTLEPDLSGWSKKQAAAMLDLPSLDPRSRALPKDPFGDGFTPVFGHRFAPSLGETQGDVSGSVSVSPTPAPAPATNTPAPRKNSASAGAERESVDRDFAEWYMLYPRKKDKGHAVKAYRSARKKASAEELLDGLRCALPEMRSRPAEKVPYPATWLNGERWADEQAAPDPAAHSWATALEVGYCGTCGGDVDIDGTGHHDGCPKRRRA